MTVTYGEMIEWLSEVNFSLLSSLLSSSSLLTPFTLENE